MVNVSLVVEGAEDVRFLQDFIQFHFNGVHPREFIVVGGKSETLHLVQTKLQVSSRNVLFFDADDSDFASTRSKIQDTAAELSVPFEDIFLFPNNHSFGNLETLLKQCIPASNLPLFGCITNYLECISPFGLPDLKHPGDKDELAIYHGSFKTKEKAKGTERSYLNQSIWDLNCQAAQPLKNFLTKFVS